MCHLFLPPPPRKKGAQGGEEEGFRQSGIIVGWWWAVVALGFRDPGVVREVIREGVVTGTGMVV